MNTASYEKDRLFYPALALLMSATCFAGFMFTYFGPLTRGTYPPAGFALHLHGWSFFLWYLLLPAQALLVARGRRRLHALLGCSSVVLVSVMAFTGLLVASVRIEDALTGTTRSAAFWGTFGVTITATLLLFTGFYIAAIVNRRRPALHKRLMIMASASALGAAVFRVIVGLSGVYWLDAPGWVLPAAIFLPNLFIVAGMVYDRLARGSVHAVYTTGLGMAVATEALTFWIIGSAADDAVRRLLAAFSEVFGFLY